VNYPMLLWWLGAGNRALPPVMEKTWYFRRNKKNGRPRLPGTRGQDGWILLGSAC